MFLKFGREAFVVFSFLLFVYYDSRIPEVEFGGAIVVVEAGLEGEGRRGERGEMNHSIHIYQYRFRSVPGGKVKGPRMTDLVTC